jgi:hypothetical protein
MENNKLTKRATAFLSGYYFILIFLTACIFYDIVVTEVTGFTFGYIFAIFYFAYRLKAVRQLLEDNDHYN